MFKKQMDFGQAGDNVGLLLRGTRRDEVKRGQVLAKPGTIKTYKKFEAADVVTPPLAREKSAPNKSCTNGGSK